MRGVKEMKVNSNASDNYFVLFHLYFSCENSSKNVYERLVVGKRLKQVCIAELREKNATEVFLGGEERVLLAAQFTGLCLDLDHPMYGEK
jgi:hypothetical protein